MSKKYTKGFTLIELLVVIAIIGLLSSVVLASLNSARNKGGDAAVKSNLGNIRAQASIYYEDHTNSYGTITDCATGVFSDPVILKMITAAQSAGGAAASTCNGGGQTYAISSALKSGGTWCVDSTGAAMAGTATAGACI